MTRRHFIASAAAAMAAPAASRAPNIVLIVLDDLGYGDLGCYGQKHISTPVIDRLAREGMKFTDAYAGAAVCAPSRAVLMTGLHGGHAPVRANAGTIPILDEDLTVAEVLLRAGYATGAFGKWGLGDARTPGMPTRQGFDEFFGYLHQRHAHSYYPDFLWDNEGKYNLPEGAYSADLIARRTVEFIRRHQKRPFFAYACWTLPHGRFEVPDHGPFAHKDWPQGHKTYAAMVWRADSHVGNVLHVLRELDLDRDTIVIVTSDNGAHKGEDKGFDFFRSNGALRGEKGEVYEGGIRVPLIVRWPGHVRAGSVTSRPTAFCDVLPTLAEVAGVKVPGGIDGVSFVPTLTGKRQPAPEYLYWEHNIYDTKSGQLREDRLQQAVRAGRWKAVRMKPSESLELYDLVDDIAESRNIANARPDVAQRLGRYMQAARVPPRPHDTGSMDWVS